MSKWSLALLLRSSSIAILIAVSQLASAIDIYKSPNDLRSYKGFNLSNGLKVLLVSDLDVELAAASLNVNVGSFQDPVNREGLAHFLEHMLFLGTKKYPIPGEYAEYIKAHGGYHNAGTGSENTEYHFTILPDYLETALDRFAQFFIEPLFNEELVNRERHAVDSEYLLKLEDDFRRIYQVNKITSNPKHSFSQFAVGSLKTLDDTPQSKIRHDLIKFYTNYYSADRMALVIVAPQSLEVLEEWVKKLFSSVAKKKVKPLVQKELVFTQKQLGKDISIQSNGEQQELSFLFVLPSQLEYYKKKSIDYITFLLSQAGPNSLDDLLKKENLISNLDIFPHRLDSKQDCLILSFTLTADGVLQQELLTQYLFNYIEYLKSQGPQTYLYQDIKLAGKRNFIFQEKQDAVNYASNLSDSLHNYPMNEVLTAEHFSDESLMDSEHIKMLLSQLTPENMRRTFVHKDVVGKAYEPWYKVNYQWSDFSQAQLISWHSTLHYVNFALPKSSDFMPENFSLKKVPNNSKKLPVQLGDEPGQSCWYKQDDNFLLPKIILNLAIRSDNMVNNAKDALLMKLFAANINDKLFGLNTQFDLAGVDVKVSGDAKGLLLKINMFSDKQEKLLNVVLDNIIQLDITPEKFATLKQELKRELVNFKQSPPFVQAYKTLFAMIYSRHWHPEKLLLEFGSVDKTDLENFTQQFLQRVHVESFVFGNISKGETKKIVGMVQEKFNAKKSNQASQPKNIVEIIHLPDGVEWYYAFDPMHGDSTVVSYYQSKNQGDRAIAVNALLKDILDAPLYEQLRTKEQLGYVVGLIPKTYRERTGLIFYVESPKVGPHELNARFAKFILEFKQILQKMSSAELQTYKTALQGKLLEKPNSLTEAAGKYWNKIMDETYHFTFNEDIANQVGNIDLEELVSYYEMLFINKQTQRNIVVQSIDKSGKLLDVGKIILDIEKFKAAAIFG